MYQYLILKSYCCIFPLFIEAEEKKKKKEKKGEPNKVLTNINCLQSVSEILWKCSVLQECIANHCATVQLFFILIKKI